VFGVDAENQNPALLVGMQNGAAAMKIVGQFFKMFNRVSM
jgi:hypothetical protein